MDLNTTWFILVFVLLIGYAILDGFDLGVGVLHMFARDNHERRIHLNAIGPVWDGNEVWLLTAGGALFAAFPAVYATVFSGFYLALMLLLTALILRAVSMEFRGKVDSPRWRRVWDWMFGVGSLLPAILFGVAFGNILRGVPVNEAGDFAGTFIGLLNPYALLVGTLSLAMFVLHGALYLAIKSEHALQSRVARWVPGLFATVILLYLLATTATYLIAPFQFAGLAGNPLLYVLALIVLAGAVTVPVASRRRQFGVAFLGTSSMIAGMLGLSALSLYPRLVPSSIDLANSLTIYNASSTHGTLKAMLIIALIGMPLVIGYTAFIYRVFKGKVVLVAESY
jgi:cytochrome d ubiquinol oxidase subunit II